ncbi:glycosyltransferase family 39 protein [Streptomyces malaysiensis subsp. malaysiensis]|uniref:Glycosyltransferase family 39 protein n=1 Tax=Streptomyces malaysiensis TaxID=92644 RepID=A0ABX6W4A1_STRMQ|nr:MULTISPECIES: glycosyltransferase family 39 protein [Streptomyces]QPI56229.1 glycosyltransferase family 39 protein [Streptomyces solisilvae]UHH17704.1 glycosyltransferase family 39 protein [Streptomyces sp. HNM0561]
MSVDAHARAVATTVSPPIPARRPSPGPAEAVVVIAPLSLTIALGLWGIRRQNTMWGDESVTYQLAHRDLSQIWHTAQHIDLVHALYYAVMHEIFDLFGGGLLTLRLPSVLAMSVAASGVGLLALRLAGPRAGLLAGLVFPLLPQVQKYAQEGRSYAMVCALVTWATYALVVSVPRRARWRWAVYGSTMLLACLLHEFAVLALVAHGVTLVVSRVPRPVMKAWSVAAAGVVAGLSPLAIYSAGQSEQVSWIGGPVRLQYFLVVAVIGVACARAPLGVKGPVRLSALAVPILVLPGLLLLIASLVKPLFVDRYVVYGNIGIAVLLGAWMDYFHRLRRSSRHAWIAVVAVLAALVQPSLSLRTPQSRSNDVTAIGATVRKAGRPGDGLLYLAGQHRILTAANPEDTRFLTDLALAQDPVSSNTLAGVELPAQEIAARMLEFDRIVAVRAAGAHSLGDPREEAKASTLRRHFRAYGTTHVNGARVTVYARDHGPSPKAGTDQPYRHHHPRVPF